MSKPNVASVLLAIYASKQIANCKVPQLRYAPKSMNGNAQHSRVCDRPWAQRALQSIRFVLSVIGIKEVAVILSILSALICRSLLRLKLLTLSTEVENSVMKGSERSFWKSIETFAFYVIPTSASYAVFNYLLSELAIRVRSSVSTRLLGKFTASKVYFQVINATQLQSIAQEANPVVSAPNPDQILTNDIEHFSYALSGLFSHVMRPVVDILVNAERLYTTGGAVVPLVMGLYLVVTSNLLNYIRAPVGSFTDREQSLEGEYRSLVARIATSAEEIAALEGGKNEEANVLQSLHPLLEYSRKFAQFRCNMSFIDAVVARYWLMMLGWRIVGLHFFRANRSRPSSSSDNDSHTSSDEVCSNDDNSCDNSDSSLPGDTTKHAKEDAEADQQGEEFLFRDYQNMSKTMLALSNAVGELIMSGRDVVKVFAYAEKLSAFEEALDELLRRDAAHKEANSVTSGAETRSWEDTLATSTRIKSADDLQAPEIVRAAGSASKGPSFAPTLAAAPSESIVLEEVSIVPPSGGAPLHTGMNIVFRRGLHTIITGENGTGKSSLLRVIAGIWPAGRGAVRRPLSVGLDGRVGPCRIPVLYLPQSPYMALGSLRQQVVYPEILPLTADFQALDAELMKILRTVHLGHLLLPEAKQQQTLVFPVAPGIESTGSIASTGKQHSSEGDPQHGEDKAEVVGKAEAEKRVEVEQSVRGRQLYSLDSVVNWGEVLSGGEKQRLSLARLFYHRPAFALLDESTSAVSAEVEEALVAACIRETGATLITISHRPQLRKFHQLELHLSKDDHHTLTAIAPAGPLRED